MPKYSERINADGDREVSITLTGVEITEMAALVADIRVSGTTDSWAYRLHQAGLGNHQKSGVRVVSDPFGYGTSLGLRVKGAVKSKPTPTQPGTLFQAKVQRHGETYVGTVFVIKDRYGNVHYVTPKQVYGKSAHLIDGLAKITAL